MHSGILVTGLGMISGIGLNTAESIASIESGKPGVQEIRYLKTRYRGILPVSEVKLDNEALAGISGLDHRLTRTALLSSVAAKEALIHAGGNFPKHIRAGFFSANTVGGMDKTEDFYPIYLENQHSGHLNAVIHHECGSATEIVAGMLGIRHYISTISTACSSSANSIMFAARMIRAGLLDVAIAGGVDALTRFTLNGFNTLMILDKEHCKPFDENRNGLNLGEGAGYVVLASEKAAKELGMTPICSITGWNNANDAYHQTASSPNGEGSYLAMQGALSLADLQPADIDYINLHGTGTQNNDQSEGTAIERIFQPVYPKMSSTKSFTGHTLGASGGIEAVLSCMSIKEGLVYPNFNFSTRIQSFPFEPVTVFQKGQRIRNVLSNSFGFGGNCSSLIFSEL